MSQSSSFKNGTRTQWGVRLIFSFSISILCSGMDSAQEPLHALTADTLETDSLHLVVTNSGMCFDWLASRGDGGLHWRYTDAALLDEYMIPGRCRISWDAASRPSGMYLLRMNSGKFTAIRRMTLLP